MDYRGRYTFPPIKLPNGVVNDIASLDVGSTAEINEYRRLESFTTIGVVYRHRDTYRTVRATYSTDVGIR